MKLNPKLFIDVIFPVGSYYETSNADFNPNTEWGGTWVREDDGTTLVSYKSSGAFNKTIGTIVGEETHTLTVDEMPSHVHKRTRFPYGNQFLGEGGGNYSNVAGISLNTGKYPYNDEEKINAETERTGGNQTHNNVQPSKVVYRWHRTE